MADPATSPPARYVWFDGRIVPWSDARVHVFTPAVKYGAGVFEGLRGYWNAEHEQLYVFRLREHLDRLAYSQRLLRVEPAIEVDAIGEATLELLRANAFRETVHIRPMIYIDGSGESAAIGPAAFTVTAVPRPLPARVHDGVHAQVSSWMRVPDRAMPMRMKANANYHNARLAAMQARVDGYDAAILLTERGKVAEGPGMCLFIVRDGVPITPSVTSDILESITRDTILALFRERLGREPVERSVDRSELLAADEAFFCGTGWEVTPITHIDRVALGNAEVGPVTRALQSCYFDLVHARDDGFPHWRTPVYPPR